MLSRYNVTIYRGLMTSQLVSETKVIVLTKLLLKCDTFLKVSWYTTISKCVAFISPTHTHTPTQTPPTLWLHLSTMVIERCKSNEAHLSEVEEDGFHVVEEKEIQGLRRLM